MLTKFMCYIYRKKKQEAFADREPTTGAVEHSIAGIGKCTKCCKICHAKFVLLETT